MNDNATPIETLFERAEDYSNTTIKLFKLNAMGKSADLISSLAVHLIVFIAVALFALIVTIGISLWLGDLLGKTYYGFFAMAGAYAIIAILLYYFRIRWIKTPLSNSILTQMLKKK